MDSRRDHETLQTKSQHGVFHRERHSRSSGRTIQLWAACLAAIVVCGLASAKPRKAPALGAFATPQTLTGTVSGMPFTWTGSVTFTPGTGNQRTISGTGVFT